MEEIANQQKLCLYHTMQMKGVLRNMTEEITYTKVNSYQIPNLIIPDDGLGEEIHIGIWGHRRLEYLKKYRRGTYTTLLTSGKLRLHLHEIDVTARERRERIARQMMNSEGVTEQLKAENAMLWVGLVNNIRARVEEIIRHELIYN